MPAGALGLLRQAAALLTNIDRGELKLQSLVLDNAFAPPGQLGSTILDSYKDQVLAQLYKLLLSFEVLGNPRGLFNRMATGVHDAFYEPLQGGGVKHLGILKPWAPTLSFGMVVLLDENCLPYDSFQSRADGITHGITGAVVHGGALYAASRGDDVVARIDIGA